MKKYIGAVGAALVTALAIGLAGAPLASAATPPDNCFSFDAAAGSVTDYYDYEDNGSGNACPRDVDIPATIGGVSVTRINDYAFTGKSLTSATIPNSVTYIGFFAFTNNQLTSVTIPNSVTYLTPGVFSSNKLTSVAIPNSVTTIGDRAFSNNQLTSVTIPDSVTTIGDYAIEGGGAFASNQLTSITIPDSVTSIAAQTFAYNQLTSITIPDSVTSIAWGTFAYNKLTSVTIPNSITSLETEAFIGQNPNGGNFDFYSLDAYDTIWYTRLYTEDPANPNNLRDDAGVTYVYTNPGYVPRPYGGHLINPAPTTITYKNQAGDSLRPSETITGKKDNGDVIPDYLVKNGPSLPENPGDQTAIQQALQAYYRLGQRQVFTAPTIASYGTTTPASPHTMTLADRENTLNFVYSSQTAPPNPTTPTNPADPSVPGAPDTGVGASSAGAIAAAAVFLLISSSVAIVFLRHRIAARRVRL